MIKKGSYHMNEIKRICSKRYILLLSTVLIFTILLPGINKIDSDLYDAYDAMINMASDYYDESSSYTAAAASAWKEYFEHNAVNTSGNTDTVNSIKQARKMIVSQAKYIDNYKDNIEEKRQTAIAYADSGTYDKHSFEYANLAKTQYDLSNISEANVCLSNGVWLKTLFKNNYIHLLTFIMCVYTVYMFFMERKIGLYHIIRSSKHGQGILFLKRCGIVIVQTIVTNMLIYGMSAVTLLNIYGGWNGLNVAASSDEFFLLTAGNCTRIQLLGIIIIISIITDIALSFILWGVLLCFNNTNMGIFFYMLICVFGCVVYQSISSKSILKCLKYINIYYMLFPNKAMEYYNWGYSDNIISLSMTMFILAICAGALSLIICAYVNINKYFTGNKNIIETIIEYIMSLIIRLVEGFGNFCKEFYKILISQSVLLLLIVLIYIVCNITMGHGVIYGDTKGYMLNFCEDAKGLSYGPELLSVYNDYKKEYQDFIDNFDYNTENAQFIIANHAALFNAVEEYVNYIKRMNERGVSAVVINPYEYTESTGNREWYNQELVALVNVLAAIIISCGFMSYERKSGVYKLIFASGERQKWLVKKIVVQSVLCIIFACITYGIYYSKLCDIYTYDNILAPLKSLILFEKYPINPPIIVFIITDFIIKIIFFLSIQMIMSAISIHIEYTYGLLVGLILILPQLLYMIGFSMLHNISVVKYISFYECWSVGGTDMIVYMAVLSISVCVGIGLLIYIFTFFRHQKKFMSASFWQLLGEISKVNQQLGDKKEI